LGGGELSRPAAIEAAPFFLLLKSNIMTNTTTTFTIDSAAVFNATPKLRQLGAVAVRHHDATPNDFQDCYCGGNCNHTYGLPAGTTFQVPGTHSRNSLRKLLGNVARVRGVRVTK